MADPTVDSGMPDAVKKVDGWEARRERLVARREEIGSTQAQVAERGGLSGQSYVAGIEVGRIHAITHETRKRLAKGLRLSMAKLVQLLEGVSDE